MKMTFLLVFNDILKFQQNLPFAYVTQFSNPLIISSLLILFAYFEEIVLVMCSSQNILQLRLSSCRQVIYILTVSFGPMLPMCKFMISLLSESNEPKAAFLPPLIASLNYFLASSFSLIMPSIILLPNWAIKGQTQTLRLIGKLYSSSKNFIVGLVQVWTRVMLAMVLAIYMSYSADMKGMRIPFFSMRPILSSESEVLLKDDYFFIEKFSYTSKLFGLYLLIIFARNHLDNIKSINDFKQNLLNNFWVDSPCYKQIFRQRHIVS